MKLTLNTTSWYGRTNSVESSSGVSPAATGSSVQLVVDSSTDGQRTQDGCMNSDYIRNRRDIILIVVYVC